MTDQEYAHLQALRACGWWKLTDLLWARYKELEQKCRESGRESAL